jgi:hypothetical protein
VIVLKVDCTVILYKLSFAAILNADMSTAMVVEDLFEEHGSEFPGFNPVPLMKVVNAYLKSVEGLANGQIIKVYD